METSLQLYTFPYAYTYDKFKCNNVLTSVQYIQF
jgi:hypothetical protein